MFPKIIHQSWKDENLNDLHLRWSQTWKDLSELATFICMVAYMLIWILSV